MLRRIRNFTAAAALSIVVIHAAMSVLLPMLPLLIVVAMVALLAEQFWS